jgi:23S rRNA pseudouridine2605 synthase
VTQARFESLAEGITIDGMHYGSINANLERRTGRNCWIEMSLTEGKNREVRRVLAHLGLQVSRLIRTAYGPLTLEGLEPGDADEVDSAELDQLRKTLK